jgi:uncharacterized protein YggE
MRIAFALALVAAGLVLGGAPRPAAAAPTVRVTGEATVSQAPDRASLNVSIVTNSDEAQSATSQNNATYAAVVGRLGGIGIEERDVRTSSFNISFVPKPEATAQYKPPRTGYIVTRELTVTIDNLALVGRAIDAAVAAGATQIDGVRYGLRDSETAYAKALSAAMHDAGVQAAALAESAHLRLGSIQSIAAGRTLPGAPVPLLRVAAAQASTTIPPSNVEIHASVVVTYGLQP